MITRIQYKNHIVLGNLYLDFQKPDGTPYKTIVLAGENGCGKTTILQTLATFLNNGSILPFDYIEYTAQGEVWQVTTRHPPGGASWNDDNFAAGHHYLFRLSNNSYNPIVQNKAQENINDILYYGCVLSKARSGFKTQPIEFVKANVLDVAKYDNDNSDDFTSIKQLLVDIESQDSSEWMNYSFANKGANIDNYEPNFRLSRFKTAFNGFFEKIKFKEIKTVKGRKQIVFTKNNKDIDIDHLSTGEQQIVFRGAQLLRNSNSIKNGIVLIDEPELSMHPRWQSKILNYYRNLFQDSNGQAVQIILATHSEEVLKTALNDSDTLVITLKEENGVISQTTINAPIILPTITSSEINYLAFGICSTDFHIALFSQIQNFNGLMLIKDVDNYIKNDPHYIYSKHFKQYSFTKADGSIQTYDTLPVYIRNSIDHPDNLHSYNQDELKESIELLIQIINHTV